MRNLTLKQVQYFLAVARAGQMSASSVKVHITQAALTASIKELESALGVVLFDRSSSGVILTREGKEFLGRAESIESALASATRELGAARKNLQGCIRLAGTPSTFAAYLVPAAERFCKAYPNVRLEFQELSTSQLETALRNRVVDFGFSLLSSDADALPRRGLNSLVLARARRQLWLAPSHSLIDKRNIRLIDLQEYPYALYKRHASRGVVEKFWEQHGATPQIKYTVSNIEAIRSLVADGLAVTIFSDAAYRPFSMQGKRIELRPLADGLPSIDVAATWRPQDETDPTVQAFLRYLDVSSGELRNQQTNLR